MGIKRKANGQFEKGSHWRPHQAFRDRSWLLQHYVLYQRSAGEIAAEFGTTDGAIYYWLDKHGIERRSVSETRAIKHWGSAGPDNPMWNRRGELSPNWRGGVTAERQAFYSSAEWRRACSTVWKRDEATCQRCGLDKRVQADMEMHVHHVVPFSDEELRAEPDNLILLCAACHHFVHSKRNVDREFLPKE